MRGLILFAFLVLISTAPTLARGAAGSLNPWQELKPEIRAALEKVLVPDIDLARSDYVEWYRKWHCSSDPQCKPDPKTFPAFNYNHMMNLSQRVSAACTMYRIIQEFPDLNSLGLLALKGVGITASLEFAVANEALLKQRLESAGYVMSFRAGGPSGWGLRSPHTGAHLHWKRAVGTNYVNVHIDFENPGAYRSDAMAALESPIAAVVAFTGEVYRGGIHIATDLVNRNESYTPGKTMLRMQPSACGVGLTDLVAAIAVEHESARAEIQRVFNEKLVCHGI